jgi:hypothetical protein
VGFANGALVRVINISGNTIFAKAVSIDTLSQIVDDFEANQTKKVSGWLINKHLHIKS